MSDSYTTNKPDINNVEQAGQIILEYESFIRSIIHTQNLTDVSDDDIFQDFYLSLVAKPVPKNVRNIKSFLYKSIINHLSSSYLRMRAYEKKIQNFRKNSNFIVNKFDPTSALLIREDTNKILELIKNNTSNKKYTAILLRYKEGYTIEEVADKMGIKYASVARYISTGLRMVRQCIGNF